MPGSHQPKYQRNILGLRNRNPTTNVSENESNPLNASTESDEECEWNSGTYHDSLKVDFEQELSDEDIDDDDNIEEWNNEWDIDLGCATPGFQARLILMAARLGDDPHDEDWIPAQLRAKRKKQEQEKKSMYQYHNFPLNIS